MCDNRHDAILLTHHDPSELAFARPKRDPLMAQRTPGFIAAQKGIACLSADMHQADREKILIDETPADETVEAAWKHVLRDICGFTAQEILDHRVIQKTGVGFAQVFNRLQQDPRVHVEENADPMQNIGPWEAFATEIAVELCAIYPKLAAQGCNRRIGRAEEAQIATEDPAQSGRIKL